MRPLPHVLEGFSFCGSGRGREVLAKRDSVHDKPSASHAGLKEEKIWATDGVERRAIHHFSSRVHHVQKDGGLYHPYMEACGHGADRRREPWQTAACAKPVSKDIGLEKMDRKRNCGGSTNDPEPETPLVTSQNRESKIWQDTLLPGRGPTSHAYTVAHASVDSHLTSPATHRVPSLQQNHCKSASARNVSPLRSEPMVHGDALHVPSLESAPEHATSRLASPSKESTCKGSPPHVSSPSVYATAMRKFEERCGNRSEKGDAQEELKNSTEDKPARIHRDDCKDLEGDKPTQFNRDRDLQGAGLSKAYSSTGAHRCPPEPEGAGRSIAGSMQRPRSAGASPRGSWTEAVLPPRESRGAARKPPCGSQKTLQARLEDGGGNATREETVVGGSCAEERIRICEVSSPPALSVHCASRHPSPCDGGARC